MLALRLIWRALALVPNSLKGSVALVKETTSVPSGASLVDRRDHVARVGVELVWEEISSVSNCGLTLCRSPLRPTIYFRVWSTT
ncbi:uncharacterized protein K452DRAFT_169278 [Aplosporella prunicola CBS 121167]|uniref:Uncharacterized protein n=1 Tax=Aplosporella prunicola CBS 121167 TaxID=1176127 RepID=A0A6A6BGR0_9PEZI|nr:uncharacterized protein K452DRAFT_169278 [Aplosporella prunicola CBS 121167]KAF2143329.1 hypothetical protein K452DRAFT_169278 [Aplosporella prunicola CBS 121167]